ncbi:MAG: hypothetical protein ACI3YH_03690 [Eubacteriales bacterium]
MKEVICALLILLGVILGISTQELLVTILDEMSSPFAMIIVLTMIGGLLVGWCMYRMANVYSYTVWGVRVSRAPKDTLVVLLSAVGCCLGGLLIFWGLRAVIYEFEFIRIIVYIVLVAVSFTVGGMVSQKTVQISISKNTNALILEQFEIFKDAEQQIAEAEWFCVSFEGVAFCSKTNYCYSVLRYEDYQLGSLTVPNEVAMVGMYFVQKYGKQFKFKVDMEVIPGEPGQTFVTVGSGGVNVGRTSGTKDKRLFRSYIFTRRH